MKPNNHRHTISIYTTLSFLPLLLFLLLFGTSENFTMPLLNLTAIYTSTKTPTPTSTTSPTNSPASTPASTSTTTPNKHHVFYTHTFTTTPLHSHFIYIFFRSYSYHCLYSYQYFY